MKTKIKLSHLILLLFISVGNKISAQVGVNILTPHYSAALQVESPAGTAKGLLTPSMTTAQRLTMTTGTNVAAEGVIIYDKDHHMHYYFNTAYNRWISLSPFSLSPVGSATLASGVITTPPSSTFSVGINKQIPTQALDVVGNSAITGSLHVGSNTGITGSLAASGNFSVGGNANITGSVNVTGFATNALVPTGVIVMWSGTLIPVGWAICDGGTYGGIVTPDLRARFVVGLVNYPGSINGAGQYQAIGVVGQTPLNAPADGTTQNYGAIGNTGGENGHSLSLAEMPNHTHNVSATVNNSNVFGFNGFGNSGVNSGSAFSGDPQTVSVSISETGKGSNQIHENRPPYYVLAYIIKMP